MSRYTKKIKSIRTKKMIEMVMLLGLMLFILLVILFSGCAMPNPPFFSDINLSENGSNDFAVVPADFNDNESVMHTSLDPSASPSTGWYLVWEE